MNITVEIISGCIHKKRFVQACPKFYEVVEVSCECFLGEGEGGWKRYLQSHVYVSDCQEINAAG